MKTKFLPHMATSLKSVTANTLTALLIAVLFSNSAQAATKTSTGDGNWSSNSMWSPSGVPDPWDDVIIRGGDVVTVDGDYSCDELDLGNATSSNATVQITSASNSLTIGDFLRINPNAKSSTYILNAGPGTINIQGGISYWSTTGTNQIKVSTGTINFTQAVTLSNSKHDIIFTGAGTINFLDDLTDSYNGITTFSGCTMNFSDDFTASTTTVDWNSLGTANFLGTGSVITANSNIIINSLTAAASKSLTFSSTGGGTFVAEGTITLENGSTFTTNKNFQLDGNWTNNGGSFVHNNKIITLNGTSGTIGGTSATTFYDIVVGKSGSGAVTVSYTTTNDITCNDLSFDANTQSRTLALGTGKVLTITDDLTIAQTTIAGKTNTLDVSAGSCTVGDDLSFPGTSITTTKVSKVNVTSGAFNVNGDVTWSTYPSSTKVIAVSTGTVSFANSLTMGSSSGTIDVTGAATVNFNGATEPSFTFGGSTAPVFNTAAGANIYFAKGFSATTTALAFATGSSVQSGTALDPVDFTVTGSNTLTNNGSLVIYGDLNGTAAGSTFVNGSDANLTVYGSVMPTGMLTATASGNTITYGSTNAQTIKATTYNNLAIANATKTLAGNISAKGITINSGTLDDAGYTITINGAGGFTNNGGTFTNTGAVSFTGSTPSQIGGVAATFKSLSMGNSGGVTLNTPVTVTTALALTSGVITTSATNYLQLNSGATSASGSASSYVEGPMYKVGNTDFVFPLGNGGRWRRVGVTGMTSPTTRISAQYFSAAPPSRTSRNATIGEVSSEEYWDIDRTVTSDPIKITLYWESKPLSSLSLDCSSLVIAHYKNGEWIRETSTLKSSALSCLVGGSGSMETDWVSTFSPFGFGGDGGGALPIKLASFEAVPNGKVVETKWVTELEINNAYFTLERSTDVENWIEVARVDGAGNSTSMLSYEKPDLSPLTGTSYYRLKQTDFDGQFSYSQIVPVTIEGTKSALTIYPNPTDNELTMNIENPSDEISVTIYDLQGRKMYANIFPADNGNSSKIITLQAKYLLPTGVYMLSVSTNGIEHRERIILN